MLIIKTLDNWQSFSLRHFTKARQDKVMEYKVRQGKQDRAKKGNLEQDKARWGKQHWVKKKNIKLDDVRQDNAN